MLAGNKLQQQFHVAGLVAIVGTMALVSAFVVSTATSPAFADDAAEDSSSSFDVTCRPTHNLADDPIVFPGQAGASHMHLFVGNRNTDANSTADELREDANDGNETTCRDGYASYDASGYWTPALFVDGERVNPTIITAAYEKRGKPEVKAYPAGMLIVFGDAHADSPQPESIVQWSCERESSGSSSEIPDCGRFNDVTLRINAPDCWDGRQLDSSDHKSHLAYSTSGSCPSSHPVETVGLKLTFTYPISNGDGVTLSSGSTMTAHADFMNGWSQRVFDAFARNISD